MRDDGESLRRIEVMLDAAKRDEEERREKGGERQKLVRKHQAQRQEVAGPVRLGCRNSRSAMS